MRDQYVGKGWCSAVGGGAPEKNRFCEDELLHVGKDLLDLALVGLVELAEGLRGRPT